MNNKYMVLRRTNSHTLSSINSHTLSSIKDTTARNMEDISLSTEEMTAHEVTELLKDRRVQQICPVIPIKLIAPFPSVTVEAENSTEDTWGRKAVGAHKTKYSGKGVKVAVLDTGICGSHSAFNSLKIKTKDFTDSENGANDGNGHGTHCAGTICGKEVKDKNGKMVNIGVAPGIDELLVGKILDDSGSGNTENIFKGIMWAHENRAQIISMSLGVDFYKLFSVYKQYMPDVQAISQLLEDYKQFGMMYEKLIDIFNSSLIIAAAGNSSDRANSKKPYTIRLGYPAAAEMVVGNVLSVAALRQHDNGFYEVAPFSNSGACVSAPGVNIISASLDGGLRSLSGTSMATPHVAGVAACYAQKLKESNLTVTPEKIKSHVMASASREFLQPYPYPSEDDVGIGQVQCPMW